jgi:radical SAM superfamily enzyme YgiQ (UPF0313 family)
LHEQKDYYQKYPFIDLTVVREGEITFKNLLEAFVIGEDYKNVKGLVVNNNLVPINTGSTERISELSAVPSPYLTGLFDNIMKSNPEVT